MTNTLPIETSVDKEVFAAMGLAIATWSAVERALALHLMRLLRAEKTSAEDKIAAFAVTTGMEVRTVLGLMRSLVGLRFPDHEAEFAKMAEGLADAYTNRRNILAHAAFAAAEKPDRIGVYTLQTVGKLKGSNYDLTAKEIRNWAFDFHERAAKVDNFFSRIGLSWEAEDPDNGGD